MANNGLLEQTLFDTNSVNHENAPTSSTSSVVDFNAINSGGNFTVNPMPKDELDAVVDFNNLPLNRGESLNPTSNTNVQYPILTDNQVLQNKVDSLATPAVGSLVSNAMEKTDLKMPSLNQVALNDVSTEGSSTSDVLSTGSLNPVDFNEIDLKDNFTINPVPPEKLDSIVDFSSVPLHGEDIFSLNPSPDINPQFPILTDDSTLKGIVDTSNLSSATGAAAGSIATTAISNALFDMASLKQSVMEGVLPVLPTTGPTSVSSFWQETENMVIGSQEWNSFYRNLPIEKQTYLRSYGNLYDSISNPINVGGFNYNFSTDSNGLEEMSTYLDKVSIELNETIQMIYEEINSIQMNGDWEGEAFLSFLEKCLSYKEPLQDLVLLIKSFSTIFSSLGEETIALVKNIDKAVNGEGSYIKTESNYETSPFTPITLEDSFSSQGLVSNNSEIPLETTSTRLEEQPPKVLEESVTIRSGQKVNYNGEECYFLMRDGNGTDFYVKSNEKDAQVYKTDENGNLVPYTSYGSNKIVSREEFVKDRKNNMDYEWNITYNNGTSPYTNVSSEIDKTFIEGVKNAEYTNVVYDQKYLTENAVTLDNFDRGEMGIGEKEFPSVLYLAPGQSVKYDVPWDTYDNEIKGGESGTYLVYNPEQHAYYKVDENGNYHTRSEEVRGLYITEEQLLSERTTFKK